MISDLIHTFLNNFHYLNAKGKRSGCLLFSDTGLTLQLEKAAKKMCEDLTVLAEKNDISEEAKGDAFYTIVANNFRRAEDVRAEHGRALSKRKTPPINMLGENGAVEVNYWVKPRKPAKFERQLVLGLDAVVTAVAAELLVKPDEAGVLASFAEKCGRLSADIRNFKRQERCIANVVHVRHKNN